MSTQATQSLQSVPETTREKLDQALAELDGRKQAWVETPLAGKIDYAKSLLRGTRRVARGQVEAAVRAKGLALDSPQSGEEWIAGPYVQARTLRLLIDTLEQLRDHGRLEFPPADVRDLQSGQISVKVFPTDLLDRLLYSGFRADVWMQPGVTRENLHKHIGGVHKEDSPVGKVALVLGAGNVASIGPLDAVNKLFNEGQVPLLKLNPVNDYLGPFIEDAFAELIEDGFMRVVYGGADVGEYLCHHPVVEEIHITGSEVTHDVIVFGAGEEGARRKAENRPRLTKRITSELGNVSPAILVPGEWSDADLQFQAENLATQMTQNGGFNCNATKVLVTSRDWPQREAFLDRLRAVLSRLRGRPAYYPGADQRLERFLDAHPQAEVFGENSAGRVRPTLIPGLDPDSESIAFQVESFCALAGETALPGRDAREFLANAVEFCNTRLRGTLNAEIVIHPDTAAGLGTALDEAVADLRYGSVGVNQWPAIAYALGTTTWGAFPGHTLDDIQSGVGVVHNAMLFDRPEKSVVTGPFRVFPKPAWFVTHRGAHRVGPKLVELEADPSLLRLPGILLHALRG